MSKTRSPISQDMDLSDRMSAPIMSDRSPFGVRGTRLAEYARQSEVEVSELRDRRSRRRAIAAPAFGSIIYQGDSADYTA
jgi:hypothetical protein